jgi:hypothetical protein
MLVSVTTTQLEGDSCSWHLSYQFLQPQKELNSLTKLSAFVIDLGTTDQGTQCLPLPFR